MRVTVLGAGAGGTAAVVELVQAGYEVALWNRSPATLEPLQRAAGIEYEGVLGEGFVRPRLITSDLAESLAGAEAAVCVLPTLLHGTLARALAQAGIGKSIPVVLNPGHTGGALEFKTAFRQVRADCPPVADFSTLTYVARKYAPQRVTITGHARQLRAAALPGDQGALEIACRLFPAAKPQRDVLAANLANLNMVLHPPGAVLGAAWVEAKRGDFTFYVEGMTPGVTRVMKALDDERRAVAAAFGHTLPNLVEEMQLIGTVEAHVRDTQDFAVAISGGKANSRIKAPDSLAHRYYREDFGHGLLPFIALANIARVPVPVAQSLFSLGEKLIGTDFSKTGRTAEAMGIAGLDRDGLLEKVRAD